MLLALLLCLLSSPQDGGGFFAAVAKVRSAKDDKRAMQLAVNALVRAVNRGELARRDPKRLARAFDTLTKAAASQPIAAEYTAYSIARVWSRRGDYEKAASILDEYGARKRATRWLIFERCQLHVGCLITAGEPVRARRVLLAMRDDVAAAEKSLAEDREGIDVDAGKSREARVVRMRKTADGLAAYYGARGQLHLELGLAAIAGSDFNTELQMARTSASADALLGARCHLIDHALQCDQPRRALRLIAEARKAVPEDDLRQIAQLLVFEGMVHALRETRGEGSAGEATELLLEAVSMPELDHSHRIVARNKLLHIALNEGDLEQAAEHESVCARLLSPNEGARRLSEYSSYVGFRTWLLLARGDATSTEELEDQLATHSRAFTDLLAASASGPPRLGGTGFLHDDNRKIALGALVDLHLAIATRRARSDGAVRALAPILAMQANYSLSRARGTKRCSVAEVRRDLIRAGCGALAFLPARRHTHVFAIDERGVRHFRTKGLPVIKKRVDDLLAALAAPDSAGREGRVRYAAAACRDVVLTEAIERAIGGWKAITIVGGDLVSNLPFESLPLRDGDRLLGEAFAVDNLSSLPLGVHLSRQRVRDDRVGGFAMLATLSPPPAVAKAKGVASARMPRDGDVAAVIAAHAPDHRLTRFDDAATLASFFAMDWTRFDVVQVVAHGVREAREELGAGLALSDAVLLAGDDRLRRVRARGLWILSACESAASRLRVGGDVNATNLGGALMWQGADTIVASDVAIYFRSHMALSRRLHEGIANGLAPATALRDARRAAARGSSLYERCARGRLRVFGIGQVPLR